MTTVAHPLPNRRATRLAARSLAPLLEPRDLVVLEGDLGAGKTFFVRALCRALKLDLSRKVQSPTFSLVHPLETEPPVAHADLYRLKATAELAQLGLEEMRDLGHILLVEWGRPHAGALGGDGLLLVLRNDPKRLEITGDGPRGSALAAAYRSALARMAEAPC